MIENRFGYYEGSKEDFVSDGLVESTSADKITFVMGDGEKGDAICTRNKLFECASTVDAELSATSTNPVQNKAIHAEVTYLRNRIQVMSQSQYDALGQYDDEVLYVIVND